MTPPPASVKTYAAVYVALMILLGATYVFSRLDLGVLNYAIAAAIALVKAALVAVFFMHLTEGDRRDAIAFGMGVLWLLIMISLTMTDYATRGWLYRPQPWVEGP